MGFCPTCRQEFESFATRCPDCEVELTDSLDPATGGGAGLQLMLVLASDPETAEVMRGAIAPTGIPIGAVPEGGPKLPGDAVGLLLPKDFANQAIRAIDAHPKLVRGSIKLTDDGEPTLFFKLSDGSEDVLDRSVLAGSVPEIVARGDEVVIPLLEFVRVGDDADREVAVRALRGFGERGIELLARQLAVLAREQREGALYHVVRELREKLTSADHLSELVEVAADAGLETGARTLALHALGRLELRAVHPGIVALLADEDPVVREEADEALCTLSDEDMGFEPDLDDGAIAALQQKWTEWFTR